MTTDRTQLYLAADAILTSVERARFLKRFSLQDGAQVADILDQLDNTDSDLPVIETMYENHRQDVPEPGLLSAATYLCLYTTDVHSVTWDAVSAMVERIRPLLGLSDDELRSERAKRAKLELLAPLGFVDANDGEFPDDIYHALIGSFDHRKVSLENIVSVAFHAGKAAGADELRAKLRALLDVAPAPRRED
jgi:hypothetical protein